MLADQVRPLRIGDREVGPGRPAYLIAEMSGNHKHDLSRAEALVRAAKEAGADAIKLQTYTPDTLTIDCDAEYFRLGAGTIWEGRTLYDLYGEACTPWEWHRPLMDLAVELGLDCFSTPFDETAVDFLEELGVPAYKVGSFELVHLPLLRRIAATGKPVILSTGMGTLGEIEESVGALREGGAREVALLKCTSSYPAVPEEMNLRTIPHLAGAFQVPAGLSDHTLEPAVPVAAVTLGACIVEKHFTLARADGGPDAEFSLEPAEFAQMVASIRELEKALGSVHYGRTAKEEASLVFRRSLFVVRDVKAGDAFGPEDVRVIRPGHGLHPRYLDQVVGRRATRDVARGTPVDWTLLG